MALGLTIVALENKTNLLPIAKNEPQKAKTEPQKTKVKFMDFPEPIKKKDKGLIITTLSEQVYYMALILAHVLARSKDLAVISN